MVAVAAVLLVVAVVLGALLLRARARIDELGEQLTAEARAREDADAARRRAEADASAAQRARDDALEREKRARREAAEVGRRLNEEREARASADAAREAAERAAADRDAVDVDVDELWDLALAAVRRTWEVSVAPSPGLPSPLDGADDPLHAAIEVEVDAAREEAGAAIELEWEGDAVAPPAVALRALTIAQELVARLAKSSEEAVLRVETGPELLVLEVAATDGEGRSVVPDDVGVEHLVARGRYELPMGARSATGARPGR